MCFPGDSKACRMLPGIRFGSLVQTRTRCTPKRKDNPKFLNQAKKNQHVFRPSNKRVVSEACLKTSQSLGSHEITKVV